MLHPCYSRTDRRAPTLQLADPSRPRNSGPPEETTWPWYGTQVTRPGSAALSRQRKHLVASLWEKDVSTPGGTSPPSRGLERKPEGATPGLRKVTAAGAVVTTCGRDPGNCKARAPWEGISQNSNSHNSEGTSLTPSPGLPPDPSPNSTLSQVSIEMQNPSIHILMV